MMKTRAFTLIELLVVIAIIALLSSVVLASLNSARAKAAEASIKSNLRNAITAVELAYSNANPNSYAGSASAVSNMMDAISKAGGVAGHWNGLGFWGVGAGLSSDSSKNWSVDSSGLVTWDFADISGGSDLSFAAAKDACIAAGGRLPTFGQLMALVMAYDSNPPPGFSDDHYWTITNVVGSNTSVYVVDTEPGGPGSWGYTSGGTWGLYPARCVR